MTTTFDVAAAKQALARVRERSVGPDTLTDLADRLNTAVHVLGQYEQEIGGLRSTITATREQTANQTAYAERLQTEAEQTEHDALQRERAAVDDLLTLLDRALARIDQLHDVRACLDEELEIARASAAASSTILTARLERSQEDTRTAHARAVRFGATLSKIAGLAWWQSAKTAAMLANDTLR